ncbi:MAG TPA: hypothetical protein VGM88_09730 [Kofleriaceae bacterium]|jgi:hypothetical protein
MRLAVLLVTAAACSPTPYAPPARFAMLDSPIAPTAGTTDIGAQVGVTGGPIFGPSFEQGGASVRTGVSPNVAISIEGQQLHLDDGDSRYDHNAFAGHLAVAYHDADPQAVIHGSLFAGVGGGIAPAAGTFASVDVGGGFAGAAKYIRPFLVGDFSYNAPLSTKPFELDDSGGDLESFVLHPDLTIRGTFGLELGPRNLCALVGLSITDLIPTEAAGGDADPNPAFVSANVGFRAQM